MGWEPAVLMAWALGIAVYDARQRRLPNALTLGAVLAAVVYATAMHQTPTGATVASGLLAAVLALVLLLPAYAVRWVGGGDVKLGLAMALLGGTKVFLVTLAAGGLLLGAFALYVLQVAGRPGAAQRILPYGTAHGVGFVIAVLSARALPGGFY